MTERSAQLILSSLGTSAILPAYRDEPELLRFSSVRKAMNCPSLILSCLLCLCTNLVAQSKAIPLVNLPLIPASVAPGHSGFTLTVNGTGLGQSATVYWNGSPLTTTFVSSSQVQAQISAADVAKAGTAFVTVTNPGTIARLRLTSFTSRSARVLRFSKRR